MIIFFILSSFKTKSQNVLEISNLEIVLTGVAPAYPLDFNIEITITEEYVWIDEEPFFNSNLKSSFDEPQWIVDEALKQNENKILPDSFCQPNTFMRRLIQPKYIHPIEQSQSIFVHDYYQKMAPSIRFSL